jgi:hypothetical protein
MKTINQLREAIKNSPARSAWSKGAKLYVDELITATLLTERREHLATIARLTRELETLKAQAQARI